ncbi:hypothetical protein D3C78_1291170 [compost metagenome]
MNGKPSNRLPSSASGTTASSTQGTAIRLASAPLRLTGRPSASNMGVRPSAISHCARDQACHQAHLPSLPAKPKISNATAPNDNQKPGVRLASGSNSNTRHKAPSNGSHKPRWRKRRRQSSTREIITQARRAGISKPAISA